MFYESRGDGNSFYYFYDSYGNLSAIYHYVNGTRVPYHVTTNVQGDVVALYSWDGALVASYEYDAWGNCTITQDTSITGIATLNPFRYRGYYYDTDLGLYYLQSRYYDAETGRFLNADSYITTGQGLMSYNIFAYCSNNPVMFSDPKGTDIVDILSNMNDVISFIFELAVSTAAASTTQSLSQATIISISNTGITKFAGVIAVLSIVLENINNTKENVESGKKTIK